MLGNADGSSGKAKNHMSQPFVIVDEDWEWSQESSSTGDELAGNGTTNLQSSQTKRRDSQKELRSEVPDDHLRESNLRKEYFDLRADYLRAIEGSQVEKDDTELLDIKIVQKVRQPEQAPVLKLKETSSGKLRKKMKKKLRTDSINHLRSWKRNENKIDVHKTRSMDTDFIRKSRSKNSATPESSEEFSIRNAKLEKMGVNVELLRINRKRRYSDGSLELIKRRVKDWNRILEGYNLDSKMNKHEQWAFKRELVEKFDPARFEDYKYGGSWLNQKHRILLYPWAAEEKFQERKRACPVPHGFGPADVEKDPNFEETNYKWNKGMGQFETNNEFNNAYPVRLFYPKTETKIKHGPVLASTDFKKDPNFEERNYKWTKGMGQFETNNHFNSIYPVRLYYPKTETKIRHGSVTAPKKEKHRNWKRAKYDIPDPVQEIKARGINAAWTLYSGSGVHVSTQTGWMRELMNSYLIQHEHFKQNPPKEYHSKTKWIAQMREIWEKHQLEEESEENARLTRAKTVACRTHLRGLQEFLKSNREADNLERGAQKAKPKSKLKVKKQYGKHPKSRRSRSQLHLPHEVERKNTKATTVHSKKKNKKKTVSQNKFHVETLPSAIGKKLKLPASETLRVSSGRRKIKNAQLKPVSISVPKSVDCHKAKDYF